MRWIWIAVVLCTGCQSLENRARDVISQEHACPLERITAKTIDGVLPYDLRPHPKRTPPPEVAADPARLALFDEQERKEAERIRGYDRGTVIEVTGCDAVYLMDCYRKRKWAAGMPSASCKEISHKPLPR